MKLGLIIGICQLILCISYAPLPSFETHSMTTREERKRAYSSHTLPSGPMNVIRQLRSREQNIALRSTAKLFAFIIEIAQLGPCPLSIPLSLNTADSDVITKNVVQFHPRFKSSRNVLNAVSLRGGLSSSSFMNNKISRKLSKNFFLIGMSLAVLFAKLFPELGKNGSLVRPEILIGTYGVSIIFLISGLSLKLSELTHAFVKIKLNGLIQIMTFVAWPLLVGLPLTKGLRFLFPNVLPQPLLDGLLILTCLPTTINMCVLLTSASGGNVATALCNTVISNLIGIFITPALLLMFFGKKIELPFLELVKKLCGKVILPIAIGQTLRATPIKNIYSKHVSLFKTLQEILLLGIVWNAFCNAFASGLGLELNHAAILLTILPIMHISSLASLFSFFQSNFLRFTSEETVAASFCSSHKTFALGLPLINTIFEGNPDLAAYCAPIMFMHSIQLVIGSLLVPYFRKYTEKEN